MKIECGICKKKFETEESMQQHKGAKHRDEKPKKHSNFKNQFNILAVILIIVILALSVYAYTKKPSQYDEFAKCLTNKGAVIYGNDFCSYTNKQLNYFGKSKKYLNYIKCIDNKELCEEKGITTTPTWEINNETYPQVQTFKKLSALTGCE